MIFLPHSQNRDTFRDVIAQKSEGLSRSEAVNSGLTQNFAQLVKVDTH